MRSSENQKSSVIKRRDFLKILAITGVAAGLGSKLIQRMLETQEIPSYSETRLMMGTVINLTVVAPNQVNLSAVAEQTFTEMQRWINILDHRLPSSEVGRLNQTGQLPSPSLELVSVIDKALFLSAITDGAFDITIKPIVDAHHRGLAATEELKSRVNYRFIHCAKDKVSFNQTGVQVTLDGIAKGAVIDSGVASLKAQGFDNVLVEAGGDLMATGYRGSGDHWRIGLKHPRSLNMGFLYVLGLKNQAAATSGDYQFYFSEDFSKHHIIDPITFESPNELASVTVLAPTALEADALSTAIMVLGSEKGVGLVDQLTGIETLAVTKELQVHKSAGFPNNLSS